MAIRLPLPALLLRLHDYHKMSWADISREVGVCDVTLRSWVSGKSSPKDYRKAAAVHTLWKRIVRGEQVPQKAHVRKGG